MRRSRTSWSRTGAFALDETATHLTTHPRLTLETPMLESAALVLEHADLEKQARRPRGSATRTRCASSTSVPRWHRPWPRTTRGTRPRATSPPRASLAKEDEGFAEEVPALEATLAAAQEKPAPAAHPARPGRRPRRHPRGQGRRGRRRVGPVRRRPTADVPALCRAPRLEDRFPIDATESDLGGYKDVQVAIKAKGTPEPGEALGRG